MLNLGKKSLLFGMKKVYPYATGGDYVYLYEDPTTGKTYRVHEFLTDGATATLNIEVGGTMEYLVVGGGGAGGKGSDGGGGGGAGGLTDGILKTENNDSLDIYVGSGGIGVICPFVSGSMDGKPSRISKNSSVLVETTGGGGGGYITACVVNGSTVYYVSGGRNGGSGGGGRSLSQFSPGTGIAGQGYRGGTGNNQNYPYGAGGGGGGAGGEGESPGTTGPGGDGGIGVQWPENSGRYFAGGGAGKIHVNAQVGQGVGGLGGGGNPESSGSPNTGGGGGGASDTATNGGSGIVIVRYVVAERKLWTPSELTSLKAWWDVSDENSVTVTSSRVSQLNDKSGNSLNLTDTGSTGPTYTTNGLNGLPIMTFGGTEWLSAASAADWKFLHDGTQTTVMCVAKFGNSSNPNELCPILGTNGNSTSNIGFAIGYDDRTSLDGTRNNASYVFLTGGGSRVASYIDASNVVRSEFNNRINPNQQNIVICLADPSNATASNRIKVSVNSDTPIGNNIYTNTPSNSNPTHTLELGNVGGGLLPTTGTISEVIILEEKVDDLTRRKLEGYLAHKWGLTNNLPSGHPYKYEPPYKVEPEEIVTDGLVLNLDAGDYASYPRSGTTWYDISGNGNHVTLYNGITYSDGALVGNSASSAYGRTNNTLNLSSTNKITVFSIFKDPTPLNPRILYEHTDNWNTVNSNYGGFGLSCNTDGGNYVEKGLHFQLRGNVGYSGRNTYSPNLSNYQVYTTVYDFSQTVGDNETKNYINGEIVTTTLGSTYNANNTGSFGNDYLYLWSRGGSTSFNDGKLARLIIYNRALSSTEIQQNYNALRGRYGITPTYTPSIVADGLVLNLDAGDPASYSGSGSNWYDLSGNNYHQTLVSTSRVVVDGTYGFNFTGAGRAVDAGTTVTHGDSHTLIAWARPLADSQVSTWRTLWRDSPNDHPLLIQDGTNLIGYYDNNTTSFISYGLNLGTLGLENKWTMFTIVASGGVSTLYINDGSITGSVNYTSSGNAQDAIGNTSTGTQPFGYVGAAQIYNRALSSTEVQQNFNALRGRYGV